MSKIVAIDPSMNSTGVCIIDAEKGTPLLYECITPQSLNDIDRLSYNYKRFYNIFNSYKDISCIAFECQISAMRYGGNAGSILKLAENIGVLKLAIAEGAYPNNSDLIVLALPPGDIKKYATGNAKAEKSDMIAAVNGHHIKSIKKSIPEGSVNDVADAYHAARLAKSLIDENNYEKYLYVDYRRVLQET